MKDTIERFHGVQRLVHAFRASRSTAINKTQLYKLMYFWQARSADFGYDFRIHYYGPYSDTLAGDANYMSALGMLDVRNDPGGYGAHLSLPDGASPPPPQPEDEQLDQVLDQFGSYALPQLELAATIHFVCHERRCIDGRLPARDDVVRIALTLKPRFTAEKVREELTRLEQAGLCEVA